MRNQTYQAGSAALAALDDQALATRITAHDGVAFEALMRRHNSRLFRVARAILKDDAEAEDVLQEAYLDAYRNMSQFRGDAQLSTWLVRIVANRALMRLRQSKRERVVVPMSEASSGGGPPRDYPDPSAEPPTQAIQRAEIRRLLERRIDELPVTFRAVFVLREIEELSAEEVATCLGIPSSTVRTRLFRARALLREALARDLDTAAADVFSFDGERCDRIVANVVAQVATDFPGTLPAPPASND
jgi:RNA polymerase sigma-70 factor (ECF subfamily)